MSGGPRQHSGRAILQAPRDCAMKTMKRRTTKTARLYVLRKGTSPPTSMVPHRPLNTTTAQRKVEIVMDLSRIVLNRRAGTSKTTTLAVTIRVNRPIPRGTVAVTVTAIAVVKARVMITMRTMAI